MALTALALAEGHNITHSTFPVELITGTGVTPKPRLRVDASQTSFWEGREFRVYQEFNLAAGTSLWLRFVTPLDVVIHGRTITVVQGNCRFALGTGGTPAGTWTTKDVFPVNAMSEAPSYTREVQASVGGSVTGLTERDVMILETGSSSAVSVQQSVAESGMPASTYYVEVRNTGGGQLRGLYQVHWEERKPRSAVIYG